MKNFIIVSMLIFSSVVFAKTEKLKVIKVLSDDKTIVERPNEEKWLLELGIGCRLNKYEGKIVIGDYGFDPDSAGAKLILPDDGLECRIWEGEQI